MTLTLLTTYEEVSFRGRMPSSLGEFRVWAGENELPEKARVLYLKGEVWVDMSKEQVFTHIDVKSEVGTVLRALANRDGLGRYLVNGLLLTNPDADLSVNPDGTFVSDAAVADGRVTFVEGADGGFVEALGSPDMVLEVVSPSSVRKDTVDLRRAYWEAGIPEYWLVDARGEVIAFDILKRGAKGYTETRPQGGWLKSSVFGKSFRLTRIADANGHPRFTLGVK